MVFTEMTVYCFTGMPNSPDTENSAFGMSRSISIRFNNSNNHDIVSLSYVVCLFLFNSIRSLYYSYSSIHQQLT